MSIIPGTLDIRNSDGSLMALICTSMPSSMRLSLFWMLRSAFDGLEIFKDRTVTSVSEESQDSEVILQAEANEPFGCTHFSHWNRYGLTVSRNGIVKVIDAHGLVGSYCTAERPSS
jgi:hypothetical protein